LPGKVLRPIGGRPLLSYVVDSLTHCQSVDAVVLATSIDASDDPVAAFAKERGVSCHRGPLENVSSRVLGAAWSVGADALVRVCGDSPLLDPALVDHGVQLLRSSPADLVSNVAPRTFPKGQSVEVLSCASLHRAIAAMTTSYEREHVTPHFYEHPADFDIRGFSAARPRPDVRLCVDDEIDLARCEAIVETLDAPPWQAGWEACVRAADVLDGKLTR
jgi:spore coat polysaccharide biosynthesis protein SpsF (cytidylyltransferase family)